MYYGLINSMNKTVAPSYTARTTSLISASGITDNTLINAINTLDLGIISNNLPFTSNDAIYLSVLGSASACSYNFIDVTKYQLTMTGGLTFTNGITGNGINAYCKTGWIPSARITGGQNYGSMGFYSTNAFLDNNVFMGCSDYSVYFTYYARSGGLQNIHNSNAFSGLYNPTRKIGFFQLSRPSSTQIYNSNDTQQQITSGNSFGVPTREVYLLGHNVQGTAGQLISTTMRFSYLSENRFTQAQQLTMNSLVNTFLTTLGLNV